MNLHPITGLQDVWSHMNVHRQVVLEGDARPRVIDKRTQYESSL